MRPATRPNCPLLTFFKELVHSRSGYSQPCIQLLDGPRQQWSRRDGGTHDRLAGVGGRSEAAVGGGPLYRRRAGLRCFRAGGSMTVAVEKLQKWLNSREDEHLEFKEAKT